MKLLLVTELRMVTLVTLTQVSSVCMLLTRDHQQLPAELIPVLRSSPLHCRLWSHCSTAAH